MLVMIPVMVTIMSVRSESSNFSLVVVVTEHVIMTMCIKIVTTMGTTAIRAFKCFIGGCGVVVVIYHICDEAGDHENDNR